MSFYAFEVNPAGDSVSVQATKLGATSQLYFDQGCTKACTTPEVITARTIFYVPNSGTYAVSLVVGGKEYATDAGQPVAISLGGVGVPSISPISPTIVNQ